MNIVKSAAIVAVGLIALAGCQKAAVVDTAAIETELKNGVRTWLASYNAGDADAIAARYADDAVVMSPGAPAADARAALIVGCCNGSSYPAFQFYVRLLV